MKNTKIIKNNIVSSVLGLTWACLFGIGAFVSLSQAEEHYNKDSKESQDTTETRTRVSEVRLECQCGVMSEYDIKAQKLQDEADKKDEELSKMEHSKDSKDSKDSELEFKHAKFDDEMIHKKADEMKEAARLFKLKNIEKYGSCTCPNGSSSYFKPSSKSFDSSNSAFREFQGK